MGSYIDVLRGPCVCNAYGLFQSKQVITPRSSICIVRDNFSRSIVCHVAFVTKNSRHRLPNEDHLHTTSWMNWIYGDLIFFLSRCRWKLLWIKCVNFQFCSLTPSIHIRSFVEKKLKYIYSSYSLCKITYRHIAAHRPREFNCFATAVALQMNTEKETRERQSYPYTVCAINDGMK